MVSPAILVPESTGTARRVRSNMSTSPNCTVMARVVCGGCGVEFQITHRMPLQDKVQTWQFDRRAVLAFLDVVPDKLLCQPTRLALRQHFGCKCYQSFSRK